MRAGSAGLSTGAGTGGPGTSLGALRMKGADALVGDGLGGCDQTPSTQLLGQLLREEPSPSFVLAEPSGMEGPQTTNRLAPVLRRVQRRTGLTTRQAFLKVAGPFPVAGPASWSDDWHAYRPCPYPHLHEGLDIFARWGTPLVAVTKGIVSEKGISSISGLYVEITNSKGFQFFYAHLSSFAKGLREGQGVHQGQVVGYVGDTGNARGGSPHVHLEVQPGGTPTPPKPFVDRWLLAAVQQAQTLAAGQSSRPAASSPSSIS